MTDLKKDRIESIDLLRGVVMVIMALDHVRDFYYFGGGSNDPTNLATTTPMLFFTRFITHFCAPTFIFLAGTSAFLYGTKKTKGELSKFLLTRGLWLLFIELIVMNFAFTFDIQHRLVLLLTIWAIAICMIFLSALVYLPRNAILTVGLVMVFGHNLLDGIVTEGGLMSVLWAMIHQQNGFPIGEGRLLLVGYPVVPWIGVMALGYCFGALYSKETDVTVRRKWLVRMGTGAIVLFFVLRGLNIYADLVPWSKQKDFTFTVLSFMNVTKYPPSLDFLLITLGPAFLFLYAAENYKGKLANFFLVYGKVPFFYYIIHFYAIHLSATIAVVLLGGKWSDLVLTPQIFFAAPGAEPLPYGYPLWITYTVWILLVLALYPLCKWYMHYKERHREKWWLSYL